MRKSRKLMSILLVVAMLFTLVSPAMADDGYTITITNTSEIEHEYEAYQIFAGTVNDKGNLGNIVWGSGISADGQKALGEAKIKAESLKTAADAEKFAKEVAPYLNTASGTSAKEGSVYTISGLAAGYYFVKDKDDSLVGANDAYTKYMLKVVNDVNTKPKSTVPQVQKKVKDINDSTGETTDWQDSADYDIGDNVPFQLKVTLGNEHYEKYEKYYLALHDTQSSGLTFNNDAKVYVNGTEIKEGFEVKQSCADNCTFEIVFEDLKQITSVQNGSEITVEYTAKLNDQAVLGSTGNPNEVKLEFSNNPNWKDDGSKGPTGETPKDKVIVFTYKVDVNKKDENKAPLVGASFELFKKVGDGWVSKGEIDGTNSSTFTWTGLDDGDYKLEETKTPAGYNTIDPIEFTITATHDVTADEPTLLTLDGGNKFTGDVSTGALSADVENKSGATLPETGGIGTTIFYVAGGALVLGAAVLLVTRRRMAE